MNVIYLKDRFYRRRYVSKTEALLPYDLGDLLVGELEKALSEPLDAVDMPEEQRIRVRESF